MSDVHLTEEIAPIINKSNAEISVLILSENMNISFEKDKKKMQQAY